MREITFQIPGNPPLTIHAMEQGDGSILFELEVLGGTVADIRGLYFNFADNDFVSNLAASGDDLSNQSYGDASNFRNGNNVKGGGRTPYDVGLDFGTPGIGKDHIDTTSFVLSSIDGEPLTLDLIAQVEFAARVQANNPDEEGGGGPQKITALSPAAPDAIDDEAYTLEDTPVTVDVTDNDTDADGDSLTVLTVYPASNGTVEIVGNQILYTSNQHWSGVDSFSYRIYDGDGGYDVATATITVEAVADAPDLSLTTRAGTAVNEIIVDISSALVDTDGSETYILTFSDLPDGAILQGANGGQILLPTGADSVTLVLDDDTDFDFDFSVSATSTEVLNNDTATTTETIEIAYDYNEISNNLSFEAVDQSIWTTGDEFVFSDDRFLGIDISDSGGDGGLIKTDWSYSVKAGFQSSLTFEGGDIDAEIPWQLDFETRFNRTTDILILDTDATLLNGGFFETDGPSLEYMLDFIFDYSVTADIDIYKDLGDIFGTIDYDLFDLNKSADKSINIVDYDSDTAGELSYDFPYGITATLAWPNLEVDGSQDALGTYSGNGASNNVLDINLDIDQALADIYLGGNNPFDFTADFSLADATLELLDVDVSAGLNFLQDFLLQTGHLDAFLVFENNTTQSFSFGDELIFNNASALDANSDGIVEFEVVMDLVDSTLHNDTDLGFNVGWNLDLLKGTWSYGVDLGDIIGSIGDSGSFGPAVDLGEDMIPVFDIDVFDTTVGVNFIEQSIDIFA